MRLILVEDDPSTLEIIRDSINWSLLGIEEVDTALNIVAAKQLFLQSRPDIAVCDIEMPLGSGLDLLGWARERGCATEFIFLTNHESFHFATAAIEHQALSYLLKPFDAQRLTREVIRAVEKIQSERRLAQYSQFGGRWIENRAVVEQRFWSDLLFGRTGAGRDAILAEAQKRGIDLDPDREVRLILLSTLWRGGSAPSGAADRGILEYRFTRLCAEALLGDAASGRCVGYGKNDYLYAALLALEAPDGARLRALPGECLARLGLEATLYVGDPCPLGGAGAALAALEEIDRNNVQHRGAVLTGAQFAASRDEALIDVSDLVEMLTGWKKIRILNELKRRLDLMAAAEKIGVKSLYALQQNVVQAVYVYLNASGVSPDALFDSPTARQLAQRALNSLYDMIKWQSYFVGRALDYVKELQADQPVIERAKQFVAAHYMENITRSEVAAHVFLTGEYFAKLFKKEAGLCVKEYINMERIQRAKLLLSGRELSVAEIAVKVGFDNISYFSTLFKKQTGLSPNEYRSAQHRANAFENPLFSKG